MVLVDRSVQYDMIVTQKRTVGFTNAGVGAGGDLLIPDSRGVPVVEQAGGPQRTPTGKLSFEFGLYPLNYPLNFEIQRIAKKHQNVKKQWVFH